MGLVLLCQKNNVKFEFFSQPIDSLISRSRNVCACKFLKSTCTHMLFVDADIVFNPRDVFKLVLADKEVIAGVYPKKSISLEDIQSNAHRSTSIRDLFEKCGNYAVTDLPGSNNPREGIQQVYEVPTGFLLMKRIVFSSMLDFYPDDLEYTNDIGAYAKCAFDGKMYNFFPTGLKDGRLLSEDYGFCSLWRDMGNKLYADFSIKLTHIGQMYYYGNPSNK